MKLSMILLTCPFLLGCATRTPVGSEYVGTWQYDRVSLRERALASAIDSVSGGEPESLSAEEFEEVRAWVYENHAGWDKSIEIKPDGTYVWTSCVGESTPEIMRGTWRSERGDVTLYTDDGSKIAIAVLADGMLRLTPTDAGEIGVYMAMNPVDE
ncbi:MAG: hypothetical protein KDA31_00710 [Phycisphaerales bacterium]|nr:hypothetical protein [Phycisphaerales bacterium]MCB9837423.1 hypothetical protein [Phycisphaera sp.]